MEDVGTLWVNDKPYTFDDLTFREQRQMRDYIRQLAPEGDVGDGGTVDYIPAFVTVIAQRDDSEFTLEDALDLKPADLAEPVEKKRPPTRARAKK